MQKWCENYGKCELRYEEIYVIKQVIKTSHAYKKMACVQQASMVILIKTKLLATHFHKISSWTSVESRLGPLTMSQYKFVEYYFCRSGLSMEAGFRQFTTERYCIFRYPVCSHRPERMQWFFCSTHASNFQCLFVLQFRDNFRRDPPNLSNLCVRSIRQNSRRSQYSTRSNTRVKLPLLLACSTLTFT